MPKVKKLIKVIKIPKVVDDCLLYFAQNSQHIPFPVKRVYFITNAHPKLPRGYHAHKKTRQVFVCIQGSIRLILDNGRTREEVILASPQKAVYIGTKIWHEMHDFKKNTILLVLASEKFNQKDYIRDYREFVKYLSK